MGGLLAASVSSADCKLVITDQTSFWGSLYERWLESWTLCLIFCGWYDPPSLQWAVLSIGFHFYDPHLCGLCPSHNDASKYVRIWLCKCNKYRRICSIDHWLSAPSTTIPFCQIPISSNINPNLISNTSIRVSSLSDVFVFCGTQVALD